MKRSMIIIASTMLALAAAAQDGEQGFNGKGLSYCKDGKLVAIQLIAPAAGVITIQIPPDVCKDDAPKPARPAAPAASRPARTT